MPPPPDHDSRLRESEEQFHLIFEHAPTGIAIADLDGRVLADLAAPASGEVGAVRHLARVQAGEAVVTVFTFQEARSFLEGGACCAL